MTLDPESYEALEADFALAQEEISRLKIALEYNLSVVEQQHIELAEARREERERNILSICLACREAADRAGPEAEFQADPSPMWWHGAKECKAAAIRLDRPAPAPAPAEEETR